MSAFGGKADSDQPLLTDLDLWVHGLADTLAMFILFNRITVRDRVDVGATHARLPGD